MICAFSEMFSYSFMLRAFIVGVLTSLCAAILGVSLVLKRYSMIGDGLSHVGFGALAFAAAFNAAPMIVAVPLVTLAAFLLLRMSEKKHVNGDAAIAVWSGSALAIGVIVISTAGGANTDVYNYLFGSVLALSKSDTAISIVLSTVVLIVFVLFYNRILAVTFDETFASATGVKTGRCNTLIAVLTAAVIVMGMRMMGAMLISSLLVFPALSAMSVCKKFRSAVLTAAIVSVLSFTAGLVGSYFLELPTGACVVAVNLVVFLIFTAAPGLKIKLR